MVACAAEEFAQGSLPGARRTKDQDGAERFVKLRYQLFWMHSTHKSKEMPYIAQDILIKIFVTRDCKELSLVDFIAIILYNICIK